MKYNNDIDSTKEKEIHAEFLRLKRLPGIASVSFGKTITERGKGFTHALVMELESKEVLIID
jgi:hypothetical protein